MGWRLVLCRTCLGAVVICRVPECVGRNDGIVDGCNYVIHDGCEVDYNGNGAGFGIHLLYFWGLVRGNISLELGQDAQVA